MNYVTFILLCVYSFVEAVYILALSSALLQRCIYWLSSRIFSGADVLAFWQFFMVKLLE